MHLRNYGYWQLWIRLNKAVPWLHIQLSICMHDTQALICLHTYIMHFLIADILIVQQAKSVGTWIRGTLCLP